MKQILIVDDHPIMRQGLSQLIRAESDLDVCGEASSAAEGLALLERTKPDLAIVDLTLKDKHGLELIKDIKAMYPDVLIVVLSMHEESLYAERVLRSGAQGYVMKEVAADTLIHAVRAVLRGGIYLSDTMAANMLAQISGQKRATSASILQKLTDREMEILQLIGQGKTTRFIAHLLNISVRTVDAHRAHIKEKLQITDGAALVRYAVRWVEGQG